MLHGQPAPRGRNLTDSSLGGDAGTESTLWVAESCKTRQDPGGEEEVTAALKEAVASKDASALKKKAC